MLKRGDGIEKRFENGSCKKRRELSYSQATSQQVGFFYGFHPYFYAFVMVPGYLRMMYGESTEDEKLEPLIGCHLRAWQYFGVCRKVFSGRDDNGRAICNKGFAGFASHCDCKPYRNRTKGKVENGTGYHLGNHFWPRSGTFVGQQDLQSKSIEFCDFLAMTI